jgi:hypothetical protein
MTRKAIATLWYPLDALSTEWSRAGRRLGQASSARCVVGGCYSMAFVALRTGAGNRAVCFRHYVQLDEASVVPQ